MVEWFKTYIDHHLTHYVLSPFKPMRNYTLNGCWIAYLRKPSEKPFRVVNRWDEKGFPYNCQDFATEEEAKDACLVIHISRKLEGA